MNEKEYQRIDNTDGSILFVPNKRSINWTPKTGEECWSVTPFGDVTDDAWTNSDWDKRMAAFYNVFPSERAAESAKEDMRRCNAIIQACRLVDPDYVPDWTNWEAEKFSVVFDRGSHEWTTTLWKYRRGGSSYVSTREKAEEVCKLLQKWGEA